MDMNIPITRHNTASAGGLSDARLAIVVALIEEGLGSRLMLADMAKSASLSPFHFARMFKISTGRSPHAFMVERRIARSKQLLLETEQPIQDIAKAVGFATQSHFTSVFRRMVGDPPSKFRLTMPPSLQAPSATRGAVPAERERETLPV